MNGHDRVIGVLAIDVVERGREEPVQRCVAAAGYDPITDFAPVTRLTAFVNVMVVPNSSPAISVKEFIDYAKTDRGNIQWQVDLLWSHRRLAEQGDDPINRWKLIVETLRDLKAADKLTVEQAKRLPEAARSLTEAISK